MTKAEELLSKHLHNHGGDGLGITDRKVYMACLDAIQEALNIGVVSKQRELLIAYETWINEYFTKEDVEEQVDKYLKSN